MAPPCCPPPHPRRTRLGLHQRLLALEKKVAGPAPPRCHPQCVSVGPHHRPVWLCPYPHFTREEKLRFREVT